MALGCNLFKSTCYYFCPQIFGITGQLKRSLASQEQISEIQKQFKMQVGKTVGFWANIPFLILNMEEVWGLVWFYLWIESLVREADRQLDRHTDAHVYISTHRQADKAVCQPVRNLQASSYPTSHSDPAASTWRRHHKSWGMCTNSALLRNQGSRNTMAGFILWILAFQWRPLCLSLHCPVMKTTHAGKKLIGLTLCVCDGVDEMHKLKNKYWFSCPAAHHTSVVLFVLFH